MSQLSQNKELTQKQNHKHSEIKVTKKDKKSKKDDKEAIEEKRKFKKKSQDNVKPSKYDQGKKDKDKLKYKIEQKIPEEKETDKKAVEGQKMEEVQRRLQPVAGLEEKHAKNWEFVHRQSMGISDLDDSDKLRTELVEELSLALAFRKMEISKFTDQPINGNKVKRMRDKLEKSARGGIIGVPLFDPPHNQ